MAEIIISALLPIIAEQLTSAALNKLARSKEIKLELNKLQTSLPLIQALLNDASDKETKETSVKLWLNHLQHLAYDIDDVLDSLATDAMHHDISQEYEGSVMKKVKKLIIPTCCTTTFLSSSSQMYDKLNEITTELKKLYDQKNDLGLNVVNDGKLKNINRSNETSLLSHIIVGRKGEKEILVHKLLDDHEICDQNNKFSIVPIVGMGGIGKTTLARLLYNEPKVKDHFELKAWVCVSDEFDSFSISKVIFQSITGEEKKFEDLNLLQVALKNELVGKRFLLVLDDVWSDKIQDWETLVSPFDEVAPGSKVIITTRKENLVRQLGYGNPYHLNKLSHEDALSLFAKYSLGVNNFDSYETLRPYGEAIVQKCDGLPLALKALGSLLRTKVNEEEWKELSENEIWSFKDDGGILPALRLSYLDLSARLKQFFAYTCLFPKDYVFEKEDLIWLWMAEGFLPKPSKSVPIEMERLGETYFDELLSRSFFEYVDNDKSLFVMHDLMNDLATFVAGEFFIRLDIDARNEVEEQTSKRYRHMSFLREEFMAYKKFEAIERANSLRTFLAVPVVVREGWESFNLSKNILVDILPHLPLLRVLNLSKLEIDEVPESVGKLKHLRYLNLSETQITQLPEDVCNLYNLQTLILFGCRELSELPKSFLKLKNLRHFDIRDTPLLKNMPLGIDEMKSLQTLSKIIIRGENEFPISGLKTLKNLRRRVCIHGLEKLLNNDQAREANLSQMKLSELVLEWSDVFDDSRNQRLEKEVLDVLKPHRDNLKNLKIISYGGAGFPIWVGDFCFSRLTNVSIKKCRNCMFLPPLGQLPSLKKLSIKSMDNVKEVGSELLGNGPAVFPSLEVLTFKNMSGWEVWSVNAVGGVAVFPCLKELRIKECPNMVLWEVRSANADVAVFPCLEELSIDTCPNLVKVSLEILPSLSVVKIEDCDENVLKSLVGVASSVTELNIGNISRGSEEFTCKVSLPLLKVLRIDNCGEGILKSLIGVASSVTKMKIDCISGLSDEVWGGVVQSLGVLEELEIRECHEIINLWESEEETEVLVKLKKLVICFCDNLVRIGGGKGPILPLLLSLSIWSCEILKHLSCPDSIETLDIIDCKNLEHLSCPGNSIQKLKIDGCKSITSVSFSREGWQKLKSLDIKRCHGEVLDKELEKQLMKIIDNNTNMLEVVYIMECEYLKSITKYISSFIHLTTLKIIECPMIIESFPDLHNLTSLKHMEIARCPSMDGPPPVGVWPPKLESLKIGGLKRPISEWGPLPTSSLVHLALLGGFGSSSSSSEEEDDIKSFPNSALLTPSSLISLAFYDFMKLERISSEGLRHLTSLQHLTILSCPKLKDLPETLLPSLLSLEIIDCQNEELKEKMTSRRSGSYWPLLSHIPEVNIANPEDEEDSPVKRCCLHF